MDTFIYLKSDMSRIMFNDMPSRKKLNGIWNALSAVKLKPAIYAKIPDV